MAVAAASRRAETARRAEFRGIVLRVLLCSELPFARLVHASALVKGSDTDDDREETVAARTEVHGATPSPEEVR